MNLSSEKVGINPSFRTSYSAYNKKMNNNKQNRSSTPQKHTILKQNPKNYKKKMIN